MHEYSIVSALVDRVEREAAAHPGATVQRLHLRIGELAGVEIPLLETAFTTFRGGGVCATAELAVTRVAAAWRCTRCDREIAVGAILTCPACKRPARLVAGDDIILDRIEMEVPDV
jgi:hydrogenase nickel incorporation protein HypA/HybF